MITKFKDINENINNEKKVYWIQTDKEEVDLLIQSKKFNL